MRSVWSGNLAFGLVTIPVKLGSAVSSHRIGFRQIHRADQGRVRYQKTCELDEEVLESAEIGRAFETPDDQLVPVSDDDLKALPLPTAKTIEVSGFMDVADVDSMQLDSPYFLAPASPAANKPYVLMREALSRAGKVAVGKFAMRGSEHLAVVRPREDILMLQTLRWPDELNAAQEAAPKGKIKISDSELRLADTLIDALGEADLSGYRDEYAQAVEALVTAKLEGAQPPAGPAEEGGGKVVDLMAALQASVDRAREGGGREGKGGRSRQGQRRDATVTELKPSGRGAGAGKKAAGGRSGTAKKTTVKKTTAKKSAAEQGPSKRTPAEKAAPKKTSARKSTAKKAAATAESSSGTPSGKKSTAHKSTARKTGTKDAGAKDAGAKKSAGKKTTGKKTASKKTAAASGTGRRSTGQDGARKRRTG
jgi:DNA end-binding protein Ku